MSSASAGRLWVTGHDADYHCGAGDQQCHYVQVAARYVRNGAPNPGKPMLLLDKGDLSFGRALGKAGFSSSDVVVMDPQSASFASTPLSTSRYSAILIASDASCGGCDLNATAVGGSETPDSDAINKRRGDIERFFNAGGGIFANAGGSHGDGTASSGPDTYYDFIPLPLGGQPVSPPFCLTSVGAGLGLQDPAGCPDASKHVGTSDDINCCATHNSFQDPPSGSALRVAERDLGSDGTVSGDDKPETLVADGRVSGGRILSGPVAGKSFDAKPVSGKVFFKCKGDKSRARLTGTTNLSVGCTVFALRGKVRITSAANRSSTKTKSGVFYSGDFKVREKRSRKPLTELRLVGKLSCGGATASRHSAYQARRRRRLWGSGKGRFRTRGRRSSATVRGTKWLVQDTCSGTLTVVRRGKVTVSDFFRHKTVTVRAGHSYFAGPRKP